MHLVKMNHKILLQYRFSQHYIQKYALQFSTFLMMVLPHQRPPRSPLFQLGNEQRKQCEREPSWVRNDMGVACSISNIMQNMINSI